MKNPQRKQAGPAVRRRGVTVLEAALVMPIVLALVFGTIEFAYVFYVKQTLQSASREGARRGAVSGSTNADVTQAVSTAMEAGGLGTTKYEVTVTNASTNAAASVGSIPPGDGVCVEVSAPWSQFSVFLSGFGDWTRGELRSKTVMRREE